VETEDPRWAAEAAAARLSILDAMNIAVDRRDELMRLIGASPDADQARVAIQAAFGFDDVQAHAVLDLQIRRFAELERSRIARERESIQRSIGEAGTDL
jgi:DNA gyrase subunit A